MERCFKDLDLGEIQGLDWIQKPGVDQVFLGWDGWFSWVGSMVFMDWIDGFHSSDGWFSWIGSMLFMDDWMAMKAFFKDGLAFSRFFKDLLLYLVRPGFPFVT